MSLSGPGTRRSARSIAASLVRGARSSSSDVDFRGALRGGGWTLGGTLLGRSLAAISALVAAAALGSRDYGALSLILTTALVLTAASALGLPVAVLKLVAQTRVGSERDSRHVSAAALLLTVVVGAVMGAGLAVLSGPVASHVLDRADLGGALAAAAPLVLLTPLAELVLSVLTGMEAFATVAWLRVVRGALGAAALLAAVAGASVVEVLLLLSVAELLSCAVELVTLRRSGGLGWDGGAVGPWVRPVLAVALPAMVAGAALLPALWIGQVLLSHQPDGLRLVGIFTVAYRWHVLALFVPAALGSVLLPILGRMHASNRADAMRLLFWRYALLTVALTLPAAVLLAVLAPVVMGLQGPQYAAGAATLMMLSLAVVPAGMNTTLGQLAVAEGRLRLWVVSDVVLAVVFVGAAALLVPVWGSEGLAAAFGLGYVATCLALLPLFRVPGRGRR